MKVAVVGAGLAGLACAWLLARRHDVVLYERQPRPGFTSHSIAVAASAAAGGTARVDVPLRVFYPGYYPTLSKLYATLGVPSEPVSYAASFADAEGRLYFRYRNLRWRDRSYGVWAPQDALLGARAWRIGIGLLRCHARARAAGAVPDGLSIADWAARERLPQDFVDGFLLPAICTVCTCDSQQARAFPAAVVIDYLLRGLARESVRRACGGADDVQARLLDGIPTLRCDARIHNVRADTNGARLQHEDGHDESFDHVVLATQANQALRLLAAPSDAEREVLSTFRYTPVRVLTHRDATLMPERRRDWSPVNLQLAGDGAVAESTIWVNAVQPSLRGAPDVFQTVHPLREPRPELLLASARFERPLVDARSTRAWERLAELQRAPGRRLWFCGAYAAAGIPLLESAVRSAHDIAVQLGAQSL